MGDLDNVLVQQGAEAKLFRGSFLGKRCIFKERFSKKYRHPDIDKSLTKQRLTQEVRALVRCRKIGILCPTVYFIDQIKSTIVMEEIVNAETLKEYIFKLQVIQKKNNNDGYHVDTFKVIKNVGKMLSKIHNADIIHGDLTTSNMLIKSIENDEEKQIYLIDFGLSTCSGMAEEKGVDLYVLERAFSSTHPNSEKLFSFLLSNYFENVKSSKAIGEKFEEIRMRGRKRSMLG